MSFASELKQATGSINKQIDRTWRRSVSRAFNQVINSTPVDTGQARNSWLMGDNNDGAVGSRPLNVSERMVPVVGNSVLLYSNLPYIEKLENGSSNQAPNGMVKVAVAAWPNIVRSESGNN